MFTADKVFYNGKVLTQDSRDSTHEAIALVGNRVLAVGTNEQVRALAGPSTRLFDLGGRTLLPGFIDAHTHFISAGLRKMTIDLSPASGIKNIQDILDRIHEKVKTSRPGEWVRGTNYDQYQLEELRHPLRWDLDKVAPENPVVLYHYSGHAYTCNSAALKLAGIGRETADPKGGIVDKVDGEPSGLLKESAQELLKPVNTFTDDELDQALRLVDEYFFSSGITTTEDMWVVDSPEDQAISYWLSMVAQGKTKTRVVKTVTGGAHAWQIGNIYLKTGITTGFGNDKFRYGAYKVFLDGTPEVSTAALDEPYFSEPDNMGLLCVTGEELCQCVKDARSRGWQFSAHVIGERAVRIALDAFEECERELKGRLSKPLRQYPYRLEHLCYVNPEDLPRFKELGVQPIVNPVFFTGYNQAYDNNVGESPERMVKTDLVKSFLDLGLQTAFGSDCPVCPVNPFLGIEPAVTRKTVDGRLRNPAEAVTLREALRIYTYYGAVATGEESVKGSLEPGKLADLVVLCCDVESVPQEELSTVMIDATVIDGEIIFARNL